MKRGSVTARVSPEFRDLVIQEQEKMKKNTKFPEDITFTKVTKIIAMRMRNKDLKLNKKKLDMEFIKF